MASRCDFPTGVPGSSEREEDDARLLRRVLEDPEDPTVPFFLRRIRQQLAAGQLDVPDCNGNVFRRGVITAARAARDDRIADVMSRFREKCRAHNAVQDQLAGEREVLSGLLVQHFPDGIVDLSTENVLQGLAAAFEAAGLDFRRLQIRMDNWAMRPPGNEITSLEKGVRYNGKVLVCRIGNFAVMQRVDFDHEFHNHYYSLLVCGQSEDGGEIWSEPAFENEIVGSFCAKFYE